MARIPRAQELGLGDEAAQTTRGVVNVPTIDQSGLRAGAAALDQVGDQILRTNNNFLEFGKRLQKAQIDRSVAEANIGLADDLDKLNRRLTESGDDPTTFEKTYDEESKKLIDGWGQKVPGGGRDPWMQRAQGYQLDGKIAVRSLMRQRQLEGEQAKGIAILENVRDRAGDMSLSPAIYGEMQTQARQLVADQLATGVITKDVAQRYMVDLDNAQVADNSARWQSNFDALATQGKIAEAEEWRNTQMGLNKLGKSIVDPKVLESSKRALDTAKPKYAADAAATDIYTKARAKDGSFDFTAGIAEARKIADPMVRDLTIQQLGQMMQQDKVAHEQEQDAAAKDLFEWTRRGNDPTKAPPSLLSRFDNASRMASSISLYNSMQAERGMTEAEKAAFAQRSKRISRTFDDYADTNTQRFAGGYDSWSPQRKALYDAMRPDEQLRVDDMVRETRINGRSGDAVTKLSSDLMDVVKRYAPSDWKIGSTGDNETAQALAAREMIREIAAANAESTGGKPLDARRLEELALPVFRKLDDKKNWLEIPVVEMQSWAGKQNDQMTVTGIDNVLWAMVKTRLTGANGGVEPSNADIVAGYVRQGGKLPAGWN